MSKSERTDKTDIHFILSSAGGSGKSSVALVVSEILGADIFDASLSHPFLSRFKGVNVAGTHTEDSTASLSMHIDTVISRIIETAERNKGSVPIVADMDSALCVPFIKYLSDTMPFVDTDEMPYIGKIYLHLIYSPETHKRTLADVRMVSEAKHTLPQKSVVLWVNEYKMPASVIYSLDERIRDIGIFAEAFGDTLASIMHIRNNEAIKPVFRKHIYEPECGIKKSYARLDGFSKSKMRSFLGGILSQYREKINKDLPGIQEMLSVVHEVPEGQEDRAEGKGHKKGESAAVCEDAGEDTIKTETPPPLPKGADDTKGAAIQQAQPDLDAGAQRENGETDAQKEKEQRSRMLASDIMAIPKEEKQKEPEPESESAGKNISNPLFDENTERIDDREPASGIVIDDSAISGAMVPEYQERIPDTVSDGEEDGYTYADEDLDTEEEYRD